MIQKASINIKQLTISGENTIQNALLQFENNSEGILFVIDKQKRLLGSLSDGDVRRALLKGKGLGVKVKFIMNPNPYSVENQLVLEHDLTRKSLYDLNILYIPIVNKKNILKEIVSLRHSFKEEILKKVVKKTRQVLVVGGAGYIGSVLVRKLLDKKYTIKVLDSLLYGDSSIKNLYNNNSFHLIIGDTRNISLVESAVKDSDYIVHMGEIVGDQACALDEDYTLSVNLIGTQNLVESAIRHGVKKFIYTSSCSVYGFGNKMFTEKSNPNPLTLYAKTKLACEKMILKKSLRALSPTILRLSTVFGWSFRPRFDLVINAFALNASTKKQITIEGGEQWRPFVHIQDVADSIVSLLKIDNRSTAHEIFNVGSNELNIQIRRLAEQIQTVFPNTQIVKNPTRKDLRSYKVDFNKFHKVMGVNNRREIIFGVKELRSELAKNRSNKKIFKLGNNLINLIQE